MAPSRTKKQTASKKKSNNNKTKARYKRQAAKATTHKRPVGRPRSLPEWETPGEDIEVILEVFTCEWVLDAPEEADEQAVHICGEPVKASELAKHIRTHTQKYGEQATCEWKECKRVASMDLYSMPRHIKSHLDMDRRRCLWCGSEGRRDYYRTHHGSARNCGVRQAMVKVLVSSSEEVFLETMEKLCGRGGSPLHIAQVAMEDRVSAEVVTYFRDYYNIDIAPPSIESSPPLGVDSTFYPTDSSGPATPSPEPEASGSNYYPSYDHFQLEYPPSYPLSFHGGLPAPEMALQQPMVPVDYYAIPGPTGGISEGGAFCEAAPSEAQLTADPINWGDWVSYN
ncbi:hypothetical protein C8Q73DRAFT_411464 [Cubamyces lactineus]|nr:hypothetical protein C8Q73DRAFT_411464 [Cubamyces lactineus]